MTATGAKRLRVLLVEGDDLARRRLRVMLDSLEALERVEEADSAPRADAMLAEIAPDLVLLDLDLPGAAAMQALRRSDAPCVVATTAYPALALGTFEVEAADCLVKPVERDRLARALARVRRRLAERRIAELALEIVGAAAVIQGSCAARSGSDDRYPDQMTIRVRRRMFALPVADIAWIEGASQYSRLHAKSGEYLLSRSLSSLACELDPARFFRIHRSAIVNAAYVREVMSRGDGRYNVYLQGGEVLPLGRGRREVLDRLLGGMRKGRGDSPLQWKGGDSPLQRKEGGDSPLQRKDLASRNDGGAEGDSPQKNGGPKAAASG